MSSWRECKLGDVANINPTESLKKGTVAKKIPMDALQPFTKKIPKFDIEQYNGGVKFKNGDTLVARITPSLENGKTSFVDILDENEIGFGSTEFIVLREKKGESDKHFLYYLAMSPEFREVAIKSMTGSSGRQRVQNEVVFEHEFFIPPLEEQKVIAEVLSSLDNKIDLLHRQNQTLESLAQTLFRQWFIEEAKEEWEDTSLFDCIILVGGGTPKTTVAEYWDGNIGWLAGGDISSHHKGFIHKTEKTITQTGLEKSSAKLLPKHATVISARGTVGKYCLLAESMAFSQSNYGVLPKFEDCYFFTYLLISHSVEELQAAAYGSVFDTITTKTFQEHNITLPNEKTVKEFEKEMKPYFTKIESNTKQIQTLEKMRDVLLPKLLSGEVRI